MKTDYKKLIVSIVIPLAVGGLAGVLTRGSMQDFESLRQPPLSPPAWPFPVVWTILYILMGVAFYLVWNSDSSNKAAAVQLWLIQLGMNFVWPLLFFKLNAYGLSFIWLLVLWVLIGFCILLFASVDRRAGFLMLPYFLWVTFAAYLNLGVFILNR